MPESVELLPAPAPSQDMLPLPSMEEPQPKFTASTPLEAEVVGPACPLPNAAEGYRRLVKKVPVVRRRTIVADQGHWEVERRVKAWTPGFLSYSQPKKVWVPRPVLREIEETVWEERVFLVPLPKAEKNNQEKYCPPKPPLAAPAVLQVPTDGYGLNRLVW